MLLNSPATCKHWTLLAYQSLVEELFLLKMLFVLPTCCKIHLLGKSPPSCYHTVLNIFWLVTEILSALTKLLSTNILSHLPETHTLPRVYMQQERGRESVSVTKCVSDSMSLRQQLDAEVEPLYVGNSDGEEDIDHTGHSTCGPTKWDHTVRGVNDAYHQLFLQLLLEFILFRRPGFSLSRMKSSDFAHPGQRGATVSPLLLFFFNLHISCMRSDHKRALYGARALNHVSSRIFSFFFKKKRTRALKM